MKQFVLILVSAAVAALFIYPVFACDYGTIEPLGNCLAMLDTSQARPNYFAGTDSLWSQHNTKTTALKTGEYAAFAGINGRQVWHTEGWYAGWDYPLSNNYNIVYSWTNVYWNGQRVTIEVRNTLKDGVFFVLPMKSDWHGFDCGFYEVSQADFWAVMYNFGLSSKGRK